MSGQLGFLTVVVVVVVVVVFCRVVDCVSLALKSPHGEWSLKQFLFYFIFLFFRGDYVFPTSKFELLTETWLWTKLCPIKL